MHKIRIHKKNYKLPSQWSDLSEKQLTDIIFYIMEDKGTEEARKLRALIRLLNLKNKSLKSFLHTVTDVQKVALIDCINWMFETFPDSPTIKKITSFSTTFIPPRQQLDNATFGEFVFADSYFEQYMQTRELKHLDKLIACLYRPKRNIFHHLFHPFAEDYRIKFNPVQVDKAARLFSFLPLQDKLAMLLFYIGCRKFIVSRYSVIFEGGIDYSNDPDLPEELRERLKEQSSSSRDHDFGWLAMANNISKSGQYGTYEQTMNTNLHTILYNHSMDMIQAKNNKQ